MAKDKVRCTGCGKVNRDALADRCVICGTIFADAVQRRAARLGAVTEGKSFGELVENEVLAWQEYASGRNRPGTKTRRPAELDEPKPSRLPWRH
jgi:PP-loop superfamily ATP-utilizing enzyme